MNNVTPRLPLVAAATVTLIGACFLGVAIGSSDTTRLLMIGVSCISVLYVAWLHRFTVLLALLVDFTAFIYAPFGFKFGATELGCALGAAIACLHSWRNIRRLKPELLSRSSFTFVNTAIVIWLVYVALHILFNYIAPYRPQNFAFKSFIKPYFALFAPFLMLLYFFARPHGLHIPERFLRKVTVLLLIGLVINIAIRLYEFHVGWTSSLSGLRDEEAPPVFYIPVIELVPNIYALRSLAPLAALVCVVLLTSPRLRGERSNGGPIVWLTLLTAFVGAVISGGRGTIVIAVGVSCMVLFLRKRLGLLAALFGLMFLGVAVANLLSDTINRKAPLQVARSLQVILIHKGTLAAESVESSTNWRLELFQRALAEWRSDPRIFWFGRATYEFTLDDLIAQKWNGYEGVMVSSLRRGATHNLITDLLVTVGFTGFVLYMTVMIALVAFTYSLYRERRLSQPLHNLSMICFVHTLVYFAYALIGSGYYPISIVWLLIVLVVGIHRLHPAEIKTPSAQPQFTPSNRLTRPRPKPAFG